MKILLLIMKMHYCKRDLNVNNKLKNKNKKRERKKKNCAYQNIFLYQLLMTKNQSLSDNR